MPGYSGPALIEANLPEYDVRELAAERALRAALQACKDEAKAAQTEIAKLIAAKKALDKKTPDFKKAAKDIDQRIKTFNGVAKKKCRIRHPGCVPSDNTSRIAMPKEITDAINQKYGTKVDWNQLAAWEGGAYSKGYIPWWPYLDNAENPKIVAMASSSGPAGPRIKGDLGGKPNNKSGATVGVGVDLGQVSATDFFSLLDKTNKATNMLPPEKLTILKEKIRPYFGKKGGEACKFLREQPLELHSEQINFLNASAHENALNVTIKNYEKFAQKQSILNNLAAPEHYKNLTVAQQTALIANAYQYGAPKPELLKAITSANRNLIPKIREHSYLFEAMVPK